MYELFTPGMVVAHVSELAYVRSPALALIFEDTCYVYTHVGISHFSFTSLAPQLDLDIRVGTMTAVLGSKPFVFI